MGRSVCEISGCIVINGPRRCTVYIDISQGGIVECGFVVDAINAYTCRFADYDGCPVSEYVAFVINTIVS